MTDQKPAGIVIDAAGGDIGGAARWREEMDAYLAARPVPVRVVGRGRRLTAPWLLAREGLTRGARMVFAPNNVSFAVSGAQRRVLVANALHFLYESEEGLLTRMPVTFAAQIPVVRALLRRADVIVVPCAAMAERVVHHVPGVRGRLLVHHHPVTAVGPRRPAEAGFILVPVVPAPYKDLGAQVRGLLEASGRRSAHDVVLTCDAADLPRDLAAHPRIRTIGIVPHRQLAELWRSAMAAFFPSSLEAFGYPLAEARAYGVPIIAPDSAQAREIAGRALLPYRPGQPASLIEAVRRTGELVLPEPDAFDRDAYFDRLFGDDPLAYGPPPLVA
jgi:glycosyltransferase involved in cell wall biosynthesis